MNIQNISLSSTYQKLYFRTILQDRVKAHSKAERLKNFRLNLAFRATTFQTSMITVNNKIFKLKLNLALINYEKRETESFINLIFWIRITRITM